MSRATDDNRQLKQRLISDTTGHSYELAITTLKQKNSKLKKSLQEMIQQDKQHQLVEVKYQDLKRIYGSLMDICKKCSTCSKIYGK